MRKIFFLLLLAETGLMNAQSMKMVLDYVGEVIGRLVRTNTKTYTVNLQDDYNVPKKGHRIVVYSADKGQGVVYSVSGTVNVRSIPSTKGEIIGKMLDEEGYVPETYQCLGKKDGWYEIRINGRIGYVRQDLVEWDGIDTF